MGKIGPIFEIGPIYRLTLVGFDGGAGTDDVAVALDVVDAGDGGPELAAVYPVTRKLAS